MVIFPRALLEDWPCKSIIIVHFISVHISISYHISVRVFPFLWLLCVMTYASYVEILASAFGGSAFHSVSAENERSITETRKTLV